MSEKYWCACCSRCACFFCVQLQILFLSCQNLQGHMGKAMKTLMGTVLDYHTSFQVLPLVRWPETYHQMQSTSIAFAVIFLWSSSHIWDSWEPVSPWTTKRTWPVDVLVLRSPSLTVVAWHPCCHLVHFFSSPQWLVVHSLDSPQGYYMKSRATCGQHGLVKPFKSSSYLVSVNQEWCSPKVLFSRNCRILTLGW